LPRAACGPEKMQGVKFSAKVAVFLIRQLLSALLSAIISYHQLSSAITSYHQLQIVEQFALKFVACAGH
jgi:hypothetical protein